MGRYQFIEHCPEAWPVQMLCRVLGVSCAGYYQWRGHAQPTPAPSLIVHADSQYTSAACRARIERAEAVLNFSRPGNLYDNAQAEAGWSTLKTELLPGGSPFASLEEAQLEVAHYLDLLPLN